ncbi:hypothetical protein FNF31_01601 [Cafeteria roenbergensis]|uniref:FYVE-type domain-containing protein n=1 Tax=Cafeteria roenbergensis TaxID=33653 RepID=A0A5A8DMZ8_CAFRO|nr:hypothetical protein FNF31_01601 [Cafeteria roenbergensis]
MGDGAGFWSLLESGDEDCAVAGIALLGRLAMHADAMATSAAAAASSGAGGQQASGSGAGRGSGTGASGGGGGGGNGPAAGADSPTAGAIAFHGGLAGLLGAALARLPVVSARVYRAVLALALSADPWDAAERARLAPSGSSMPPPIAPAEIQQPALIPVLYSLARRGSAALRLLFVADLLVLVGGRPSEAALPCTGFGDVISRANRARLRRAKRWPEGLCALALAAELEVRAAAAEAGNPDAPEAEAEAEAEPAAEAEAAALGEAEAVTALSMLRGDGAVVRNDSPEAVLAAAELLSHASSGTRAAAARVLAGRIVDASTPHSVVQACFVAAAKHLPGAQATAISEGAAAVLGLLCEGGPADTQAVHAWISLLGPSEGDPAPAAPLRPVALADSGLPVLGGPSVGLGPGLLGDADGEAGSLRAVPVFAAPAGPLGPAGAAVLARLHCRVVSGFQVALGTSAAPRSSDMWDAAARAASAAADLVSGAAAGAGVCGPAASAGAGVLSMREWERPPLWRLGSGVVRLWSLMSASLTGWSDLGISPQDTKRELAAAEAARALMSRARVQAASLASSGTALSRAHADAELSTSLRGVRVLAAGTDLLAIPGSQEAASPEAAGGRGAASAAAGAPRRDAKRLGFEAWTPGATLIEGPGARGPFSPPLHDMSGPEAVASATADATATRLVRKCRAVTPGGAVAGVCCAGLSMVAAATCSAVRADVGPEVRRAAAVEAALVADSVRAMTFTLRPRGDGPEQLLPVRPSDSASGISGAEAEVARAATAAAIALTSGAHLAPVLAAMLLRVAGDAFSAVASLADVEAREFAAGGGSAEGEQSGLASEVLVTMAAGLVAAANRVWASGAAAVGDSGADDLVRDALAGLLAKTDASRSVGHWLEACTVHRSRLALDVDTAAQTAAMVASNGAQEDAEALVAAAEAVAPHAAVFSLEEEAARSGRVAQRRSRVWAEHSRRTTELFEELRRALPWGPIAPCGRRVQRIGDHTAPLPGGTAPHGMRCPSGAISEAWVSELGSANAAIGSALANAVDLSAEDTDEDDADDVDEDAVPSGTALAGALGPEASPTSRDGQPSSGASGQEARPSGSPGSEGGKPCEAESPRPRPRSASGSPVPLLDAASATGRAPSPASPASPDSVGAGSSGRAAPASTGPCDGDGEATSARAGGEGSQEQEEEEGGKAGGPAAEARQAQTSEQEGAAEDCHANGDDGDGDDGDDDGQREEEAEGDDEGDHQDEQAVEGDWETVDITRATGDGPALYAAPCSLVLPHAVVEGRVEVSQRFLRFFPERLAGDDGGGGDEIEAPRPFGAGADPVAWVPDADADACHGCGAPIVSGLFFSGKHHCRRCGGVFCSACSRQRRPLPWAQFFEPVRVCDACAAAEDASKLSAAAAGASAPQRKQQKRHGKSATSGSAGRIAHQHSSMTSSRGSPAEARASSVRQALAVARMRELRIRSIPLGDVTAIYGRRFLLRHLAMEVFLSGGRPPMFFAFSRPGEHEKVVRRIWALRADLLRCATPLTYGPGLPAGVGPPQVPAASAIALGFGPGSLGPQAASASALGAGGSSGDRSSLHVVSASAAGAGAVTIGAIAGAKPGPVNIAGPAVPPARVLDPTRLVQEMGWTEAWRRRAISNFDYLCLLNFAAGRTRSDPSQYPVMPWVIADYTSESLDFQHPSSGTFRDLSKPVGALNPERLAKFRDRMAGFADAGDDMPPFLYGSHYSNMGSVSFFLLRQEPFTSMHLALQRGRFDHADRLFHSVAEAWSNVMQSQADVKELVPEFFSDPGFLRNDRGLQLGKRQSGVQLGDVVLPPWAHGSPELFVQLQREALESEHVSQRLHLWIDLVFGSKQRGEAAAAADNLFYHLTYEGATDSIDLTDQAARAAAEAQVAHFGQTPAQLFSKDHAPRLTQEEAAMAEWGAAIASAMLARRHSARRTLLRSPHRGPVTAVHLPTAFPGCITLDAWGVAATAAFGPTDAASVSEQPFALAYRGGGYLAVVAPEWTAARTLGVVITGAKAHAAQSPAAVAGLAEDEGAEPDALSPRAGGSSTSAGPRRRPGLQRQRW